MENTMWNDRLIKNIKNIIKEKGFMQKAVAERAGFTNGMFSDMLHGRKVIKASSIPNIAKALKVPITDLYAVEEGGHLK